MSRYLLAAVILAACSVVSAQEKNGEPPPAVKRYLDADPASRDKTLKPPFKVGMVGVITAPAYVSQVADESNMLVKLIYGGPKDSYDQIVWFKHPTKDLADKDRLSIRGDTFAITATKTYKTRLGQRTTQLFELVDMKEVEKWKSKYKPRP